MRAKEGHRERARAAIVLAAAAAIGMSQRDTRAATVLKSTYTFNRGSYDETGYCASAAG
jgi:hypothetical protein